MSKIKWKSKIDKEAEEAEKERKRQRAETARLARKHLEEKMVKEYLASEELSDEQKEEFLTLYDEWDPESSYSVGDMVEYKKEVYEVSQAHTAQSDWTPDSVPALFNVVYQKKATDDTGDTVEVIPEFRQPDGSHDAYEKGDLVLYEGSVYESLIHNNVWNPTEYPQGWQLRAEDGGV